MTKQHPVTKSPMMMVSNHTCLHWRALNRKVDFIEDVDSDGFFEQLAQTPSQGLRLLLARGNDEHWDEFVRWAEEKGRSRNVSYDDAGSSLGEGWGQLWEIGCKVSLDICASCDLTLTNYRLGARNRLPSKPWTGPLIQIQPRSPLGPWSHAPAYQAVFLQKPPRPSMLVILPSR